MDQRSIFLKNDFTLHTRIVSSGEVRISFETNDLFVFLPPLGIHDLDKLVPVLLEVQKEVAENYKGLTNNNI